jgi:DNA-binding winged helix-turn-helix (wHTH) protein/predicted ATPase
MEPGLYPLSSPICLDLANECLRQGMQVIPLRPKTFAVLRCLVEHAGQLVPKAALFDAVWPATAVSDNVLMVCIGELRHALRDDLKTPLFIETVHRRGYRFIGTATPETGSPAEPRGRSLRQLAPRSVPRNPHDSAHNTVSLVGRERELEHLNGCLAEARRGRRQVVLVTGEAGLGKTTLVDTFLAGLRGQEVWCGRGQCLDQYGAGEAYLPVLEALRRLARQAGGQDLVTLLAQQAPTWLVHLPGLLSPTDLEALHRRVFGVTRERMLRELAEALDVLTAERPLIVVLEDLHWSDYATLDLIAALARRQESARLLLLGTYRPADVSLRDHPLHAVIHELVLHGQCMELPLTPLTEAAIEAHLAAQFPGGSLPAGLARAVYRWTDGNPLFMVAMVQEWLDRGCLHEDGGPVRLRVGLAELLAQVPETLRQTLEAQIDRLTPEERRVLEVASVAGVEFSAAAVAAGVEIDVVPMEERCAGVARGTPWLQTIGEQVWPDGTVAACYQFTHALYQEVAYRRVTAARRVQLHRRIGERLEAGYGTQTGLLAAELAVHFERGRDTRRAIMYRRQAADRALRRFAHADAIAHLTNALALLASLPETSERDRQELDLQAALGSALMAVQGFAAPDVSHAYARARELCRLVGETPQLFAVLVGLCIFYQERAELRTAHTLAEQLLHLAERRQDPVHLCWAHNALGVTLKFMGEFVQARAHLEQSMALYHPQTTLGAHVVFDPGVDSLCGLSEVLWVLGYPDQALQRAQEGLALARELSHPFSLAGALSVVARMQRRRGAQHAVQALEEASLALCREQGFTQGLAQEMVLHGWGLAKQGEAEAGIAQMHQGLEALRATGAETERPWLLTFLAMAYGHVGRADDGLALLAEALDTVQKTGKRLDESGLYRCTGELLLAQEGVRHTPKGIRPQVAGAAEASLLQALAVARGQQAKSLELRAAMSLSRLWQRQGKRDEAHQLLADIYSWFTEGFDTTDLQEAKALLDELS